MRYSRGSLQLLAAAVCAFQVKSLVADDSVLSAPARRPAAAASDAKATADAGILSPATTALMSAHHGKYEAATPRRSGHRAMQEDVGTFMSSSRKMADAGILSPIIAKARAALHRKKDKAPKGARRHGKDKAAFLRRAGNRTTQEDVNIFMSASQQSTCTQGYIDCVDGKLKGDSSTSCKDACDGKCCVGGEDYFGNYYAACDGFTGKVCKDGSCNDYSACGGARMQSVVNSCKDGYACYNLGQKGHVGNVTNSCTGVGSCFELGKEGKVGNVQSSCQGFLSCFQLGKEGKVGNVENSCIGYYSCNYLGRDGEVGNVKNSCEGYNSCYYLGYYKGKVGNVVNSCTGYKSCYYLGYKGEVGNVTNSCTGFYASCYYLGYEGKVGNVKTSCIGDFSCDKLGRLGSVGNIETSCNGTAACLNGAKGTLFTPGSITGGMKNSCNGYLACYGAGQISCLSFQCYSLGYYETSCEGSCTTVAGGIISKLNSCCNSEAACFLVSETSLPAACFPTTKPTTKPTSKAAKKST